MPRNRQKSQFWKRRKETVKSNKEIFQGGRSTDVIIPVMGKTGVGKSTFINTLLGKPTMKVGHDIVSCTANLQWEVVDPRLVDKICPGWGSRRIIIVDTPGFDDTFEDDSEILRRIGAWLGSSYADEMKLGGIIYLQNIAERRMEGASRRNLEMFKKLCGPDALSRVILGTTSWQEVVSEVGEAREGELKRKFWKEMIEKESEVKRFYLNQESAFEIARPILERAGGLIPPKHTTSPTARASHKVKETVQIQESQDEVVLRIQEELVDMKRHIPQTDAGKELLYSIEQILEVHKQMQPHDDKEKEELLKKVEALEAQMKALHVPFFTKVKSWFGL